MTELPGILSEIAEVIGEDQAERLAEALGGREIYLSRNPGRNNVVASVIGHERTVLLARALGNDTIRLPMGARKRVSIGRRMLKERVPHSEISQKLHVHTRTVERWAKDLREDRQLSLPFEPD